MSSKRTVPRRQLVGPVAPQVQADQQRRAVNELGRDFDQAVDRVVLGPWAVQNIAQSANAALSMVGIAGIATEFTPWWSGEIVAVSAVLSEIATTAGIRVQLLIDGTKIDDFDFGASETQWIASLAGARRKFRHGQPIRVDYLATAALAPNTTIDAIVFLEVTR